MSEQEIPPNNTDDAEEGELLEGEVRSIDKDTVIEAERVLKDNLPEVERVVKDLRKTFFQSNVIRIGVVLVTLKIVAITGEIIAERMRENKKTEEK